MTASRRISPLARRLDDFGPACRRPRTALGGVFRSAASAASAPGEEEIHPSDAGAAAKVKARRDDVADDARAEGLEAARLAGYEEGLARARAEAARELKALRGQMTAMEERHAAALAETERRWAQELAARIEAMLAAELRRHAARVEELLAASLAPFLEEAVTVRAVRDFAALLERFAEDESAVRLRVVGPRALLDALRRRLPDALVEAEVDEQAAELRVMLAETLMETRIDEWLARLRAALAEGETAPGLTAFDADDGGDA